MPFGQTFETLDLVKVATLIILELLLSADNALVLAIMVRHLPKELQKKALLYGLGGAFFFRIVAIIFAKQILEFWWLQAIGAIYLLWVPLKHWFGKGHDAKHASTAGKSFWGTVIAVEITDIAFAVDSVLAGVGFIGNDSSKIWVVYVGAIFGIILLRFAASQFIRLLERFPVLNHVAFVIVGWVGIKLAFHALHSYDLTHPDTFVHVPEMSQGVFWTGMTLIVAVGTYLAKKFENKSVGQLGDAAESLEDAQDLVLDDPAVGLSSNR